MPSVGKHYNNDMNEPTTDMIQTIDHTHQQIGKENPMNAHPPSLTIQPNKNYRFFICVCVCVLCIVHGLWWFPVRYWNELNTPPSYYILPCWRHQSFIRRRWRQCRCNVSFQFMVQTWNNPSNRVKYRYRNIAPPQAIKEKKRRKVCTPEYYYCSIYWNWFALIYK